MANYNLAPNADAAGTSYHGDSFKASESNLERLFGSPHYQGEYSGEWMFQDAETGDVITIYKHKGLESWHIGGRSKAITSHFKKEIRDYLSGITGATKKTSSKRSGPGHKYLGNKGNTYFWKNNSGRVVFNHSGKLTDTVMFYRPGPGIPVPPKAR